MTPRRRIVPVFVPHLGCPHQCVFCDQRTISGQTGPADPETVQEALRSAQAVSAWAELAFYGGSFTAVSPEVQTALLEAAQPFRGMGFLVSIRVSTRPDCIDGAVLDRLSAYGVETVELGAQSMSDRVLDASGRGHRAEDTVRACRLLRERGFRIVLQMMTGLPGSDPEEDLRTAQRLADLRPDGVRIYPTLVLRGTALAEMLERGEYRARTTEEAVETCAPIVRLFREREIPILRLGLHPSRELEEKLLAGPYHPALGELVYSRLYRDEAERLLKRQESLPEDLTLLVDPGSLSKMTGRGKENLLWLRDRFRLRQVRAEAGDLPAGTIAIKAKTV